MSGWVKLPGYAPATHPPVGSDGPGQAAEGLTFKLKWYWRYPMHHWDWKGKWSWGWYRRPPEWYALCDDHEGRGEHACWHWHPGDFSLWLGPLFLSWNPAVTHYRKDTPDAE